MPEQQKRIPSRRERRAQLKANGVIKALSKLPFGHPLKKQVREANQLKMLEEAWVLSNVVNKETYREDRKEAKVLQNKVKASKAARNS